MDLTPSSTLTQEMWGGLLSDLIHEAQEPQHLTPTSPSTTKRIQIIPRFNFDGEKFVRVEHSEDELVESAKLMHSLGHVDPKAHHAPHGADRAQRQRLSGQLRNRNR